MDNLFEVRDPIHGLVPFNELERTIINSSAFQRLRRIKQLAWTDYIYPGALHNRFEHSIGVMHVAGRLFDSLFDDQRSSEILRSVYKINSDERARLRQTVRIAALTHDLGHGPFSHAAEALFPVISESEKKRVPHEEYSAHIIRDQIADILRSHKSANELGIDGETVASFIHGSPKDNKVLLLKSIISGALDADRMDYLLRDAYHCGVRYGQYDLERVINTVGICEDDEDEGEYQVGIDRDGIHAAEGLLLARYMMFTQVYLHKTRLIYDYHIEMTLREILAKQGGTFPDAREKQAREDFLRWDDWRTLGLIAQGEGGIHGAILRERNHYRLVYETEESHQDRTTFEKRERHFNKIKKELEHLECVERTAEANWYKQGLRYEILVRGMESSSSKGTQLSLLSSVVKSLISVNQKRLYVPSKYVDSAKALLRKDE